MIAELNPRRKSAINRHGTVTPRKVSALRHDMQDIQNELEQLQKMMEISGLEKDEAVKIDGACKWDTAKEAASAFLRNIRLAVAQHTANKIRQESRAPRFAS